MVEIRYAYVNELYTFDAVFFFLLLLLGENIKEEKIYIVCKTS